MYVSDQKPKLDIDIAGPKIGASGSINADIKAGTGAGTDIDIRKSHVSAYIHTYVREI
jgi:hypothetical protein